VRASRPEHGTHKKAEISMQGMRRGQHLPFVCDCLPRHPMTAFHFCRVFGCCCQWRQSACCSQMAFALDQNPACPWHSSVQSGASISCCGRYCALVSLVFMRLRQQLAKLPQKRVRAPAPRLRWCRAHKVGCLCQSRWRRPWPSRLCCPA